MGTVAAPAIPILIQVLEDGTRHGGTRANAAIALDRIGIRSQEVTNAILAHANDPDPQVRDACNIAAWRLDDQYASTTVPFLANRFLEWRRRIPGFTGDFLDWLKKIKPSLGGVTPALDELLKSDSDEIRKLAAEALAKMDASAANGESAR
jgi:HEAT repeat protein